MKIKKILSTFVAAAMMLTTMSFTAFASDETHVPTGKAGTCYTSESNFWGESSGNPKESFVHKLYSGDTLIATTSLNKEHDPSLFTGETNSLTWHFCNPNECSDEYWVTVWEKGNPSYLRLPDKLELWVDGVLVDTTTNIQSNGPDNLWPVEWEELDWISKPELPTATITEIENDELTFAMNFLADEATDDQLAYYGDWYADFELTVNKEITFNANDTADGWLSGQYDAWSENWVNVPFEDVTMKPGETLKIMEYAAKLMGQSGLKVTYRDVYEGVKDFDCGLYLSPEYLAANPDFEVTLKLAMYNPDDANESYDVSEVYKYTATEVPVGSIVIYDKDREVIELNVADVDAKESLVIELYSGDVHIATATLKDISLVNGPSLFAMRAAGIPAEFTIYGDNDSAWETVWHVAPDADLVPDGVKVYADGVLVSEHNPISNPEVWASLKGVSDFANEIKLSYEKVNDKEYKIYVESVDGKNINRLSAVEGKFDFIDLKGKATYELTAADGVTLVSDRDDENVYEFNFNPDATGTKLEIGKVTFTATEAEFGFGLVAYDETTANTATLLNNIVYSYVPDGDMKVDGKFNVTDSVIDGGVKIKEETTEVKVVIDFNNKITAGNEADYNDMKVTLTGSNGDVYEGYVGSAPATDVADDNVFYFENTAEKVEMTFNVKSGYRYTAVVKGEGYRTARYTTVVDDATTLKFWNNAMADENNNPVLVPIEEYFESSKRDITFLAGDIALDNVIDKYDLAAVVSYFGYDENTEKVDMADYVKYDLNRDGRIDADDISYVLVSWGK